MWIYEKIMISKYIKRYERTNITLLLFYYYYCSTLFIFWAFWKIRRSVLKRVYDANFVRSTVVKSRCLDHVANVGNATPGSETFEIPRNRSIPINGRCAEGMAAYETRRDYGSHAGGIWSLHERRHPAGPDLAQLRHNH